MRVSTNDIKWLFYFNCDIFILLFTTVFSHYVGQSVYEMEDFVAVLLPAFHCLCHLVHLHYREDG